MRFDTSQQMRLGQHMKLAPRMIQSMEILQMPLLQLEERIAQELEGNATLETADPGEGQEGQADAAAIEAAGEGRGDEIADGEGEDGGDGGGADRPMTVDELSGREDFGRLDQYEASNPEASENAFSSEGPRVSDFRDLLPGEGYARARLDGEPDGKSEAMNNTAARSASMTEQLLDQWRLADVRDDLRPLGEQIIGFIEEDGHLHTPLETIIDRAPPGAPRPGTEQMERALTAVQLLLEPPGVGARDVRESLLLQADALSAEARGVDAERWRTARRLIADHLDDLAQNRLPKVAEKTGLTIEQVKEAVDTMRVLTLAPGRALAPTRPGVIVPDAVVEFDEDQDRYIAYLNDNRLPNLRINQEYARMARDRAAPRPTREFLKKNLTNAQWLMEAVEQRKKTLLRVVNAVVEAQRDYFDYGPAALRPLPMTLVAGQLGIHVATVSRAVADKHLATPRGVVPLRGFFTGGTQTESGEEVSWDAVKAALKEVIDAEDKRNPMSDDALAAAVKGRGIEIARRTVAKYRDQLGVPAARLRKTF